MGGIAEIFIAGASDRAIGVRRVLKDVDMSVFSGAEIALKANYNSADPPPASTHIDTLDAVCTAILAEKPKKITPCRTQWHGEYPRCAGRPGGY